MADEFDIIRRYFEPLAEGCEGSLELKDDAGLIAPRDDQDLVVTNDALVSDVHFFSDADPGDIGFKALSVNVSDLAGKGAEPLCYLLSLGVSPSHSSDDWLSRFADGLRAAQDAYKINLLGGDTVATRQETVVSITAVGTVSKGEMVLRDSARVDDKIYVTGTIGDAALGLILLAEPQAAPDRLSQTERSGLLQRHSRPLARVDALDLVRGYATASMDISDGLVGDLRKLVQASEVGAELRADKLPLSAAARTWSHADSELLARLLTGGDDYELLMTVKPEHAGDIETRAVNLGIPLTCIGKITGANQGLIILDGQGKPISLTKESYTHFDAQ